MKFREGSKEIDAQRLVVVTLVTLAVLVTLVLIIMRLTRDTSLV